MYEKSGVRSTLPEVFSGRGRSRPRTGRGRMTGRQRESHRRATESETDGSAGRQRTTLFRRRPGGIAFRSRPSSARNRFRGSHPPGKRRSGMHADRHSAPSDGCSSGKTQEPAKTLPAGPDGHSRRRQHPKNPACSETPENTQKKPVRDRRTAVRPRVRSSETQNSAKIKYFVLHNTKTSIIFAVRK